MTEEDAKTKWCPYANGGARTPTSYGVAICGCMGAVCMMWRWKTTPDSASYPRASTGAPIVSTTDGYCGLAGKAP
jgi:hypothetical protein